MVAFFIKILTSPAKVFFNSAATLYYYNIADFIYDLRPALR